MAYFAELDDNNKVIQVVSVSNNDAPDPAPNDDAGRQFLASIGLTGNWLQTSYHGRIRGHYAAIGDTYDPTLDLFVAPQPFPSWVMTSDGNWTAPIPMPDDGQGYVWDETTESWVVVHINRP